MPRCCAGRIERLVGDQRIMVEGAPISAPHRHDGIPIAAGHVACDDGRFPLALNSIMPEPTALPDFIEVTADALDRAQCAALVERFSASGDSQPGRVGGGVMTDLKDSRDLTISGRPEWRDAEGALNIAVFKGVLAYLRRYPHTLIAPLMLETADADGSRHRLTPERLMAMDDATLTPVVQTVLRPGAINLQRYTGGRGGYPYWHCELYPRDPHAETLHRHLLWTIYLNDGFAEGETEFLYQQRKIAPRTGSLLIAPAAFTHTHRGNRPLGGDKFIATSWVLFQRAEQLFGTSSPNTGG